jgi:hypothetical protein
MTLTFILKDSRENWLIRLKYLGKIIISIALSVLLARKSRMMVSHIASKGIEKRARKSGWTDIASAVISGISTILMLWMFTVSAEVAIAIAVIFGFLPFVEEAIQKYNERQALRKAAYAE